MNFRKRLQAARQRRDEILRDLREHGWRSAQQVRRVVSQAPQKAVQAGAKMARHVMAVQKAARLAPRLVERSARSLVENDRYPGDRTHEAWKSGYEAEAVKRGILPEPEKPPEREWFDTDPHGPDWEDAELEL